MDNIQKNYNEIMNNVRKSAEVVGKTESDICVVAVTKTVDVERMKELQKLGINNFGENKVQELLDKYDEFENINWHFIGHLQKNKVKYIVDKVSLIHSVDSISLCEEIDKQAKKYNKIVNVLIQINIGEDEKKFGIKDNQLDEFVKNALNFNNIRVCGLMTILPNTSNVEEKREFYSKMRKLIVDNSHKIVDNIDSASLSMGMTSDYNIAIEEGATIIRVGTGFFC